MLQSNWALPLDLIDTDSSPDDAGDDSLVDRGEEMSADASTDWDESSLTNRDVPCARRI